MADDPMDNTWPVLGEIAATLDTPFTEKLKGKTVEISEVEVVVDGDDIYLVLDIKLPPPIGELTVRRQLLWSDAIPNTEDAYDLYDEGENRLRAVADLLGLNDEQMKELIFRKNKDKHFK